LAGSYYLTSACRTADEFVAAFRRYAERTMLFVPTQTPLPNGTRAHIAVALSDGSVMLEGEIEVVGSTTRAVGLHGRAGMSLRFIELDDTSRQVLDQLVRSRLTSRPVPLPTHLRPRPRAGTVPEPSPELQAERARAASTVPGIGPTSNVNAEAVPAECTLMELPGGAAGPAASRADIESRFDYSAPAPRDAEVHVESTVRATVPPVRPMTIKGQPPGRMPASMLPPKAAAPVAPAPAADASPAPELAPEEGSGAIVLDASEVTEMTGPPSAPPPTPVPSPPKLPATPRGRQSMSRTMLGVAPIVMKAPGPAAAPATDSDPAPAPAEAPAEVFFASWPGGDTGEHPETQKMEPMFPDVPERDERDERDVRDTDPPAMSDEPAADPADDAANADSLRADVNAALGPVGPWPSIAPARLPLPARDVSPPPDAFEPAAPGAFPQPSPDPGPPPIFEDNTSMVAAGRRGPRPIVLASFGGALLLAVIVVVIATGGGSKSGDGSGSASASGSTSASASASPGSASGTTAATTPATAPDAAMIAGAPAPADAAPAPAAATSIDAGAPSTPPTPPGAIAGTGCKATFTSTPSGADIVLGGKVAGATPKTIAVPCAAATATFKRPRYQPKDVAFTPTADGVAVSAKLDRPSFTVKVTSTPAGATVTIGGKVIGKTPLTTKQPGFENTTVTFKKDGYATATAKLYAKANGSSVKATLKKGASGGARHR
jgi:hypothetical protein